MTEHEKWDTNSATHPKVTHLGHYSNVFLPSFISPYAGNRMDEDSGKFIVQSWTTIVSL